MRVQAIARHLLDIVERVKAKKASVSILASKLDTGTPTGQLMLTMLGGVAEFERAVMLERQREGIAKAKAEKKYKGRKPTARAKAEDVKKLRGDGKKPTAIARELGISRSSVYRIE